MKRNIFQSIFFASLALISVGISAENSQKTVVTIGGIAKNLDEQTACNVRYWANKLENSCKCCLIKRAPQMLAGKRTAQDIVDECISKQKFCSINIIDQFLRDSGLPLTQEKRQEAWQQLISTLYNTSLVIKEVPSGEIFFNRYGNFKAGKVAPFLALAYKAGLLKDEDFKSASCIQVKDIMEAEGGLKTSQLFMLKSMCSGKEVDYILKEITTGTAEIVRLAQISLIPELQPYLFPNMRPGYPTLVMPVAYLSYNYGGKNHYLSLMLRAPGISLASLPEKYLKKEISQHEINKIFYETGRYLARFHKAFMSKFKNLADPNKLLNPTYVHGDAHLANIFFEEGKKRIIFIDNERLQELSPISPLVDFASLFFLRGYMPMYMRKDRNFINHWTYLIAKKVVQGYIDTYPISERLQVLHEIFDGIKKAKNYKTNQPAIDKAFSELFNTEVVNEMQSENLEHLAK